MSRSVLPRRNRPQATLLRLVSGAAVLLAVLAGSGPRGSAAAGYCAGDSDAVSGPLADLARSTLAQPQPLAVQPIEARGRIGSMPSCARSAGPAAGRRGRWLLTTLFDVRVRAQSSCLRAHALEAGLSTHEHELERSGACRCATMTPPPLHAA